MATTSTPDSDVSSTTVQVATIGGQQLIQSSSGQQFLIVNKSLQSSGGRIQIVNQEPQEHTTAKEILDAVKRREILARQPSYCKILNDLKEVESEEELTGDGSHEKVVEKTPEVMVKGETVEVVEGSPVTQTVVINGTAYQIMSPVNLVSGTNINVASTPLNSTPVSNNVQFTTSGTNGNSSASSYSSVQTNGSTNLTQAEEQARKREIRLMKNREAAKECRNKKKEYIKCLETRVAVLETQNKALIEELKSLKELYTGQKN